MSYKKLVSLFAVSALALGACGADDAEEAATEDTETEEVEETDDAEEVEEGSTQDLLDQAKGESGEATPDYGLEVSGNWTQEGYGIGHPEGEPAVIPVAIISEKEGYHVYLLENGVVSEVVSDEPEFEFEVENPSDDVDYHVGVSPDDLGGEGEEVSVDDFERSEKVFFEIEEDEEE